MGYSSFAFLENMTNEFVAIIEHDAESVIAYCLEIRGANGPGRTKEKEPESLAQAKMVGQKTILARIVKSDNDSGCSNDA